MITSYLLKCGHVVRSPWRPQLLRPDYFLDLAWRASRESLGRVRKSIASFFRPSVASTGVTKRVAQRVVSLFPGNSQRLLIEA